MGRGLGRKGGKTESLEEISKPPTSLLHLARIPVPQVNPTLPSPRGDNVHVSPLPSHSQEGWMSAHPLLFIFCQCFQIPHYPRWGEPLL